MHFPACGFGLCLTLSCRVLFTFPSQYLCAIGFGLILSLGRGSPPVFALHSQAAVLARDASQNGDRGVETHTRGLHPLWRSVRALFVRIPKQWRGAAAHIAPGWVLQAGLDPVRSPLLGVSQLISIPPPSDMLKSGGWSCAPLAARRAGLFAAWSGADRAGTPSRRPAFVRMWGRREKGGWGCVERRRPRVRCAVRACVRACMCESTHTHTRPRTRPHTHTEPSDATGGPERPPSPRRRAHVECRCG